MSDHKMILSLLDTYAADGARERWSLALARAFAARHVNVLERSNLQGHFTGSGFVVDPERARFLLVWHQSLDKWIQPGGHADGDPDLGAVAAREVEEETGLRPRRLAGEVFDVDIHTIPASPRAPAHLHYDVRFLFVGDPAAPLLAKDDECRDVAWMSRADLRERSIEIDASVERMIAKALP